MRSSCAGHSSCNVIHFTSGTDPESSIFCQTSSAGHPVPNPSLIVADVAHILCDSRLQVVEPRLHIRAKTLLCVFAGGKSVHRATPSCASTRPRGGTHASRGEVCYVYSLPPCYFTQSALPIYQTGCCSVCYTCDLSRVTDFARCRLFAQLGHTFELSSGDR